MLFDADRVARGLVIAAVVLIALGVGVVSPKLFIPDVQSDVELASPEAQRYIMGRIGTIGNASQRAPRMQVSIIDSQPDPEGCDWGYPEPIDEILTVRMYTLWGVPLETWELTCNSERRVAGPFNW